MEEPSAKKKTTKKSKAKIRRMAKRAEERGETYVPPPPESSPSSVDDDDNSDDDSNESNEDGDEMSEKILAAAARGLLEERRRIDDDADLKSKDRRSLRRRADAIACEATGMSADELIEYYEKKKKRQNEEAEKEGKDDETKEKKAKKGEKDGDKQSHNPYVVFVGQLSYQTTEEQVFEHFRKALSLDENGRKRKEKINRDNLKVRLLTKTEKKDGTKSSSSRGIAFVETPTPQLMYACLKLHHTYLDGRRINVERSAGGGKTQRKRKIEQSRQEQKEYFDHTVNSILTEYYDRGEIEKQGELDQGVIDLCKRHSATVVQAALQKYVALRGCEMDNPSAYLSYLLTTISRDGIDDEEDGFNNSNLKSGERRSDGNGSKFRRSGSGGRMPNPASTAFATMLFTCCLLCSLSLMSVVESWSSGVAPKGNRACVLSANDSTAALRAIQQQQQLGFFEKLQMSSEEVRERNVVVENWVGQSASKLTRFEYAWDVQRQLLQDHVQRLDDPTRSSSFLTTVDGTGSSGVDRILMLEHQPVYTLGTASDPSFVLDSASGDIPIVRMDRGGEVTYHGPGQLTVYPVLDLRSYKQDIHWYVRALEEAAILALRDYGIDAERDADTTGVWVNGHKVRVDKKHCWAFVALQMKYDSNGACS